MLTRILTVALLGIGAIMLATPRPALAAGQHLQEAIAETQQAISSGRQAHEASSFVEHADNAIDHAMQAQKEQSDKHLKGGIAHLRKGIKVAKGTHLTRRLEAGVKHAEKALSEFEAVK